MLEKDLVVPKHIQENVKTPDLGFILTRLTCEDIKKCYTFAGNFITSNNDVLDVGCGLGLELKRLSHAQRVVGIDISPERVSRAKEENKNYPNIEIKQMDALSLQFPNFSFDKVIAMEVIEHVYDTDKMLSEVSRVLKEDGIFLLSTPNRKIHGEKIRHREHICEYDKEELKETLEEYFNEIEILGLRIAKKNLLPKVYAKAREVDLVYDFYRNMPLWLKSPFQYSLQRLAYEKDYIEKLKPGQEPFRFVAICQKPRKNLY